MMGAFRARTDLIMSLEHEDARRLLERIGVVSHACDLDLLIFFARHPRSLLASESLAKFLGYDLKQIAASLDVLQAAGLISRTQATTHAARLYVFAIHEPDGGTGRSWLPSLLALASTRHGRLVLKEELGRRPRGNTSAPVALRRVERGPRVGPRRIAIRSKPRAATG